MVSISRTSTNYKNLNSLQVSVGLQKQISEAKPPRWYASTIPTSRSQTLEATSHLTEQRKNTCAVDSGDGAVIHADLLCIRLNTVEDLDSLCIELNNDYVLHSVASEFIPTAKYKPYLRPKWTPTAKTQHNTERWQQKLWISEGRPRGMEHETFKNYKRSERT